MVIAKSRKSRLNDLQRLPKDELLNTEFLITLSMEGEMHETA